MQNIMEITGTDMDTIVMKLVSDMQDFIVDSGDIDIDGDAFTIMCDAIQVDVLVEVYENEETGNDELDLIIDAYHNFSNYEEHNTVTFLTIQDAIEYLKSLVRNYI